MRLPFLQVSQEEMARARTLAGYLGVPYVHALGMTVALKSAALEAAPEGDVSGTIRDPNPSEWMAVQCGWPLERAEVLAVALVRCGFAVAGPSGGHAVTGLEPYARALETSSKRSEAGRRGAEMRKAKGGYGQAMAQPQPSHGYGMARDAKTQTHTYTQKEDGGAHAREAPSQAAQRPPLNTVSPSEEATPPRTAAATDDAEAFAPPVAMGGEDLPSGWCRLFRQHRGAEYLWRMGTDDQTAIKLLALANGGGVAEVLRRAGNGLAATYGQRISTPAELVRKWDANATPEPSGKPAAAPPSGDRPRLGPAPASPPNVAKGDKPRI